MCYMILLSTDSPEDLSARGDSLISFSRELPPLAEADLLEHSSRWFVGSRHGCSCGFRHLLLESVSLLGFGKPQDWCPEESDDIQATLQFVRIVKALVAQGAQVDCIDAWGHESVSAELSGTIEVDLSKADDGSFRFFENHHFLFRAGA